MNRVSHIRLFIPPLLFLCGCAPTAQAQQTVFNVPTTDVLDKSKFYSELDVSIKPNDTDALGHFSSFVPRLVGGAGHRVEVGVNLLGNIQPGADMTTHAPALKWKVYDGGGFFNTNSAHPFENPTPFSNFFEMLCIFALSAGLTYTLGRMTGAQRHGWAVFAAMAVLFFAGIIVSYWSEARGNPLLNGTDQTASALQTGGNMEGKEVRFGVANSALWATVTTDTSCGAVNSMHDSFTPLGGLVPLANIMLSEVVFGGVGSGLYGVLIYIVLSVFIAGLMVGRTPEYLGKKIEAYDVKMAMLNVLIFPVVILILAAISSVAPTFGTSQLNNAGPHGLSEILYAFTSGAGNNGSAFAGISANTYWYNTG